MFRMIHSVKAMFIYLFIYLKSIYFFLKLTTIGVDFVNFAIFLSKFVCIEI